MTDTLFAFYVSGGASRLKALFKKQSRVLQSVCFVVHDGLFDDGLKTLCDNKRIAYLNVDYQHLNISSKDKSIYLSKVLLDKLTRYNAGYCFCFGDRILKGEILVAFRNRIINFHPAVLPSFPGVYAIDKAREANSFLLGNTAHFIDAGIDTGPIIIQSIIHSSTFVNYEDVLDSQIVMLEQIFEWIKADRIQVIGNKVVIKNANYHNTVFFPSIEI